MNIKRGDVVLVNLDPVKGSEQGKVRPCLVIQNDKGNEYSPTTIIAAITSKTNNEYPFTVSVSAGEANLPKDSTILLNQIRTISISDRIIKVVGSLGAGRMLAVNDAIKTSLALD
ncbi:MAG: type II toxin-antitoxin system PemK/MazF family toxin [Candidatus Diapherotrites archaeon]|nr:type II toxin-antitoxin system PemK/MazF family toxin [Candidatus Diapherotrites archaeon]